eukprot:5090034-Amphidinium_carterae.1
MAVLSMWSWALWGHLFRTFLELRDLRKGVDIMAVQTFLTEKLLGHDSKPGSSHTASQPDEG